MRWLALLILTAPSVAVAADDPGQVCVVQGPSSAARPDLSAVVLRAVRAEVEHLFPGQLRPTPPIDFEGLQLALGCVGESAACMSAMAKQVQADTLVIVRVTDLDRGYEVSLDRVSGASGNKLGAERRRVAADDGGARALDVVPEVVPVLFGRPPPAPPPLVLEKPGPSPYPMVAAGVGVAGIVVGAIFGAMASSSESDYASRAITSRESVNAALLDLDRAEGRATTANVFFVVGGVVLAGGLTWLALEMTSGEGNAP